MTGSAGAQTAKAEVGPHTVECPLLASQIRPILSIGLSIGRLKNELKSDDLGRLPNSVTPTMTTHDDSCRNVIIGSNEV